MFLTTHHLVFNDPKTPHQIYIPYSIIGSAKRRQSSKALVAQPGSCQFQQVNPYSGISSNLATSAAHDHDSDTTTDLTFQKSIPNDHHFDSVYLLSRPSIRIRCKDFVFIALTFGSDQIASDTFDTLIRLTCIHDIHQLYAFTYKPPIEQACNGWTLYDPLAEFSRQGALDISANWRTTNINLDYQLSRSYPNLFLIPSSVSDDLISQAAKFRSKARVPALSYYHKLNGCTITRCSQPMVGLKQARSAQDETIVTEIFASNQNHIYLQKMSSEALSNIHKNHNLIVDARPTTNAMAQTAMGAGSENMENYKGARKVYLGIGNIHVMRDSLHKLVLALKDGDILCLPPSKEALHRSRWLKYICTILSGAVQIAQRVHLECSHVIIHCSDGWDRTSQLSSIAQIILDPYYRTLEGFIVLVEKEWVSFGHRFAERAGYLNSEKNFTLSSSSSFGGAHLIFKNVGSKLVRSGSLATLVFSNHNKHHETSTSLGPASANIGPFFSLGDGSETIPNSSKTGDVSGSNMKFTAPIFHQFLDAVYQLVVQFPDRFQFGERFLRKLLYHSYSCQYGTFLFNSEFERKQASAEEMTKSVWDYFLSKKHEFVNTTGGQCANLFNEYDQSREFGFSANEKILCPDPKQVKYWAELFGRNLDEMDPES